MLAWAAALLSLVPAGRSAAEALRVATWHVGLSGRGPGIALRDVDRGRHDDKAQLAAALRADILVLTGIDHDGDSALAGAFRDRIAGFGWRYRHVFSLPPNTGIPTGLDLDGDGIAHGPRDAQGYGRYPGQNGMAVLSQLPILTGMVRDLSGLLWSDLPQTRFPADHLPDRAAGVLRLSTTGHWMVPMRVGEGRLWLLVFAATPPVFDGPEDRNGLRNADEIDLWRVLMDGKLGAAPPQAPFVIAGLANLDPFDGEGRHETIEALLHDPRLKDPEPRGGGRAFPTPGHRGDPALDTADLPDPRPGNLRLSYVLPSAGLRVLAAGVAWPEDAAPADRSRHFPVWVDIGLDQIRRPPAGASPPRGPRHAPAPHPAALH